jgi:hypothetical protein
MFSGVFSRGQFFLSKTQDVFRLRKRGGYLLRPLNPSRQKVNTMRRAIQLAMACVALLPAIAGQVQAGLIVYYNDYSIGTDSMGQALVSLNGTHTTTNATSISDFTTKIATGDYDLGIFFLQNGSGVEVSNAFAALATHISQGGLAIATDWTRNATHSSAFQTGFIGGVNQTSFTVLDPALGTGLTNPVTLTNRGWATFSTDLSASGGTVAARFANSTGAVVVGNGGRTIWNGFLSDTFINVSDGVQLYTNEINSVFASQPPAAVPEIDPAGMGSVLAIVTGVLGLIERRRLKAS